MPSEDDIFSSPEKRARAFKEARDRFRMEYKTRGAAKEVEPLFSAATVHRLRLQENEWSNGKFSPATQKRLIWLFRQEQNATLYDRMSKEIGQKAGDTNLLLEDYLGEYRYFRYASHGEEKDAILVEGKIVISRDYNGDPMFAHWSHDYDWADPTPEHNGFVFRYESRLFFAARRRGIMRLAIASTFAEVRSRDALYGLVLSVRSKPSQRHPFCARFIMVHRDNASLSKELSEGGEEAFKARVKGPAYYMLAD
jgi:hypothetical protein